MVLRSMLTLWSGVGTALADHLWQSTLFGIAAAGLTLLLRKNSARLRYFVWLAASLKFLVPFSLLIAVGSQFAWRHSAATPAAGMYIVEMAGQPFTKSLPVVPTSAGAPAHGATMQWLLPVLLGIWLCGFLVVLFIWVARWWRISAALRKSVPLTEGREVSTLRHLEARAGIARPLDALLSGASLEPGIFGIFRPVLVWPYSISEHLDDSHLEGVIAHELWHVRRRDNLWAALHMIVEAAFWFHPLVWWIGARLIAERERACDEAVLEFGSQRHTYAESILKVCEFCLSSPLTCVSGVTGSDLKKRMVHIMTDHVVHKLNFTRKFLLWVAACLVIALPIIFGLLSATPGRAESAGDNTAKFATVSIKPHPPSTGNVMRTKVMMSLNKGSVGAFTADGVSAQALIQLAYRVQDAQLAGAPDWLNSEKFDINTTVDPALETQMQGLSEQERGLIGQRMLQALLADQFKLSLHQESREQPTYELVVADGGSKMKKVDGVSFMHMGAGELTGNGTPLSLLAVQLSMHLGRMVVDKTGLTGNYAFSLHWTPDADEQARLHASATPGAELAGGAPAVSGPPLLAAVEQQLGLKLQPKTETVPVLVIDHVEQPSASQ